MKNLGTLATLVLAAGGKTRAAVGVLIGIVAFAAAPAGAAGPHFVGPVTASLDSENNLQVCWKEAKLDKSAAIDYEVGVNVSATYRCQLHAGICPGAIEPVIVLEPGTTQQGTFTSSKKGQLAACLTIEVPPPTSNPCGGGPLTLILTDIAYAGITLEDTTNSVGVHATPSTISAVVVDCNAH